MRGSCALISLFLLALPLAFEGETPPKPVMVIVAYRPRPGKEALLMELTKHHLPVLRAQGLATERASSVMRAADGTIVEVFEWKSQAAIDSAHKNPVVAKMWQQYGEACDYISLKDLKEASELFASFEPIEP